MRRAIPWSIGIAVFVGIVAVAFAFVREVGPEYRSLHAVNNARTVLSLSLRMEYAGGPLRDEEYSIADVDGISTIRYRATSRDGRQAKVEVLPRETISVPAFFERVEQMGLWELQSKPPRGDTSVVYAIDAAETITGKSGSRTITFTDPVYWARQAGREYHIHLQKTGPLPDLLKISGTSTADPRYEKIVAAFLAFGPADFRTAVRQKRDELGRPA